MLTNTCKSLFALVLFLSTNSLTSSANVPNTKQCPFTRQDGPGDFELEGSIDIIGLGFDEINTYQKVAKVANTLKKFFNKNIDCACRGNGITYDEVEITSFETSFETSSLGGGYVEKYDGYRALQSTSSFGYSSRGECGRIGCPGNKASKSGFRRRLGSKGDDSRCYGPLFVKIFNQNGFPNVIGFQNWEYERVSPCKTSKSGKSCKSGKSGKSGMLRSKYSKSMKTKSMKSKSKRSYRVD